MKLKIACILIAIVICVPLFENFMFSFFKHNPGYLFETGAIKTCPTTAHKAYLAMKPILYSGPYIGLIAGVFIGLSLSEILEKILKKKA